MNKNHLLVLAGFAIPALADTGAITGVGTPPDRATVTGIGPSGSVSNPTQPMNPAMDSRVGRISVGTDTSAALSTRTFTTTVTSTGTNTSSTLSGGVPTAPVPGVNPYPSTIQNPADLNTNGRPRMGVSGTATGSRPRPRDGTTNR